MPNKSLIKQVGVAVGLKEGGAPVFKVGIDDGEMIDLAYLTTSWKVKLMVVL